MPLPRGTSRENCISESYNEMINSGHPKDQAQAAALSHCNEIWGGIPKKSENKGNPKEDGSGQGVRKNYNRGGCNDLIPPECLVKAYRHYKIQFPKLSERDLLDKSFAYFKDNDTMDFFVDTSLTLDYILFNLAQEYEQEVQDFLTLDADAKATHLQELFEQQKQYEKSYRTPEAKALRESLGGTLKPPVRSIDVPFTVRNSETGAVVRGKVLENLEKHTRQLTPVSSSNVRGAGQFKDELLVQFHGDGKTARKTYRYQMESPEMAEEAYRSLLGSGSPGRWIWENIRGHRAGEKVTKNKLGPSLSPPGQGLPTIGGTSKSLAEYSISNRVPVTRVGNFDEMSKQLKRKTSSPTKDPNVGSRVEGALEGRRQARDRGVNQLGVVRQVRQMPKLDFMMTVLNANELELDYPVKGHYSMRGKPPERIWIRRHTREEGTTIKDKPRMRPLQEWEISEIYQNRLAKMFGKDKYSEEIYMGNKTDYFERQFHHKIYIADNVDYKRNNFSIARGNSALKQLPIPFQDLAYIVFYDKITDDPNSTQDPEDVPLPYRKVGWDSKNKDVDAEISFRHKTIRLRAGSFRHTESIRHEVGHAVYHWLIGGADQQRYIEIFEKREWHLRRQGKVGKYQANDIQEFFAVQFERYYSGEYDKMFPETIQYFDYINKKFGGVNEI